MHANLLAFLAAAWLGPVLFDASARRVSLRVEGPTGVALALAAVACFLALPPMLSGYLLSLNLALLLLALGTTLVRDGRRRGLLRVAIAVCASLVAVAVGCWLANGSLRDSLATVAVPAALLVLLAPAAAAMVLRLRETDAPAAPRDAASRVMAAAVLALGLLAILPATTTA
jgi:apolipoprotein N-acyltransferase